MKLAFDGSSVLGEASQAVLSDIVAQGRRHLTMYMCWATTPTSMPSSTQQCETRRSVATPSAVMMMGSSFGWTLADLGIASVRVLRSLSKGELVFVPRGISEESMSLFALLYIMQKDLWACHVKPAQDTPKASKKRKAASDYDALVEVIDLRKGDALQWWLHDKRDAKVYPEYLLALSKCQEGKLPGPLMHFRQHGYYRALLDGEPFVSQQRKAEFDFCTPGEVSAAVRHMPRPRLKRAVKKPKCFVGYPTTR